MVTQKQLKQLLNYNPETGLFTWIKSKTNCIKSGDVAGTIMVSGYIRITIDFCQYRAHRLAWLFMVNEWPDQIDHKNHDRKDNRWCNLRNVTNQENGKNQSLGKNNVSGIAGVGWSKQSSKWYARIMVGGKGIHLGVFADKFEAICARKSAERKYGFHTNHGT